MGKWIFRVMVVMYIIYWIYSNDKIARREGSSLGQQFLWILAAVGFFFMISKFKKKEDWKLNTINANLTKQYQIGKCYLQSTMIH